MADRKVVLLTLVVELYDEQRRDEQDATTMFVLSGVDTQHIYMNYACFDTLDHIWHHIGWRLCAGRSTANAVHIGSRSSVLCSSIQQLVHRRHDVPEDEPIHVTFTLDLFRPSPASQDSHEGRGVSKPTRTDLASKSSVQSLKRKRVLYDNIEQRAKKVCVICQDEFGKKESLAAMPCAHEFHKECILGWLERAHSCPICRFQLPIHR